LDLTSVLLGPYATQILGDYGADIIKVEPPEGDIMRLAGPMRSARMGHLYLNTNRNKRSVGLDLKKTSGREVLLRLAKNADVLVYNIRPQAMERLGLSYEEVSAASPGIIYAGGFGFSQRGPYAARPAYDDLVQGMAGVSWLMQAAGQDIPRYAPVVFADRTVGLQLALAVVSALFHRKCTGRGQRIDVPMYEGLVSVVLGEHLAGKTFHPAQGPVGHPRSLARERRPFRTRNGYICALLYTDRHWRAFFVAIGQPDAFQRDVRFASQAARAEHVEEVYGFLRRMLETRSTEEWLALFERSDIPAAPMNSIDDILADKHLQAIGFFRERMHPSEGELIEMAIPTEWSDSQPEVSRHAPLLGEHTEEVLLEAGYETEEIASLVVQGIALTA
jgi:crotonobetainyl-CoA:carnitine CoA-transferase CaiB-like acyl-CoA transferase